MKTLREAVAPRDSYSLSIGSDPGVDLDPYDARTRDFLSSHAVLDAPYPEGAEASFTGGNDVKYALDDPRMSRYGRRKGTDKAAYDPQEPKNLPPQPTTESYSGDGEPELAAWAVRKDIGWGKRNPGLHDVTVAKHKTIPGVYHVKHSTGGAHVHLSGEHNYHHKNSINTRTTVVHDDDIGRLVSPSHTPSDKRHDELYSHPMHEYGEHRPIDHEAQKNMAVVKEHLTKRSSAGEWIRDFMQSKNSRFDGKSEKERRKMALGAYYAKHDESVDEAYHAHGGGKKRDSELGLRPSGQSSAPIEGNIVGAAFKAQGGRTIPFTHQDGSVTHVHPAMGRRISASIQNAPNRDRADLVQTMHRSADHLKHAIGEDETASEKAWREAAHEPMRKRANEGIESIDELSQRVMGNYVKKAANDLARHSVIASYAVRRVKPHEKDEIRNRKHGIAMAVDKLTKEDFNDKADQRTRGTARVYDHTDGDTRAPAFKIKEEDESVNELSHNFLRSYIDAAEKDRVKHVVASARSLNRDRKHDAKADKRVRGISTAYDKLDGNSRSPATKIKEDIDDASPNTADATGDAGTLMTQLRALANKAIAAVIAMPDDMKPKQWVCDAVKRANEEITRVHDCMVYGDHPDSQGPIDPVDVAAEEDSVGGME